jgi:hypothetical protein
MELSSVSHLSSVFSLPIKLADQIIFFPLASCPLCLLRSTGLPSPRISPPLLPLRCAQSVGYRADIYAAERDALARQKQARMATFAATAQAQADLRAAEDEAKAREREAKVRERIEANKLARAEGGTGEINLDSDDDEWGGGAGAEGKGGGGSDSDDSDIVPLPSKTSTVASSSRLKSTSIKPPSLSPSPPPPAAATQSAQSASAATGEVLRLTLRVRRLLPFFLRQSSFRT